MKGIALTAAVALVIFAGCEKKKPDAPPAPTATAATNESAGTSSGNPLTAPAEYISAAGRAQVAADRTLDLASLKQAITMFQATEGRYPKDLNELVSSGTLRQMPTPPRGMQIQYDAASGNVRIIKQ